MKWWDQMPWSLFFKCWVVSQLFHTALSPSSRGSLVLLHSLPLKWYHLHIWGCWYFSSNLHYSLWVIQPITSWQWDGKTMATVTDFSFLGSKITLDGDSSMKLKDMCSLKRSYDQPRQATKKKRHHFADQGVYSPSYGFSSSRVWLWELDHKEDRVLKNWCFRMWC